jgi:hypothetical protein
MVSQDDPKIRTLLERCRNNGRLEYWNDDFLLKNPIFQHSRLPKALLSAENIARIMLHICKLLANNLQIRK